MGISTLEFPACRACLQACRAHLYSLLPGDRNHGSREDVCGMGHATCNFWSCGRNAISFPSLWHHQFYIFSNVILHFLSTNIEIFVLIGVGDGIKMLKPFAIKKVWAECLGARSLGLYTVNAPVFLWGQKDRLYMHNRYFLLKPSAWWWQSVPEGWPLQNDALPIAGLFLLAGLLLGNWLCCCATSPMHFTALGNGTRLFLLPKSVSNGTQPMWRYGGGAPASLLLFLFLLRLLFSSCQRGYSRNASLWVHLNVLFRQATGWESLPSRGVECRMVSVDACAGDSGACLPGLWSSVRGRRSSLREVDKGAGSAGGLCY